ncbi:MAG: hypothetical protein J5565_06560 [Muribaculaceae bacterium]|nr:hypothetical protein [Muribaculaceae bacterium]
MKVIHLNLYEPYQGKADYYFGSVKAIYEHIPKECVGIVYTNLCTQLRHNGTYINRLCTIRTDQLLARRQGSK